jgi:hypothetical protein
MERTSTPAAPRMNSRSSPCALSNAAGLPNSAQCAGPMLAELAAI